MLFLLLLSSYAHAEMLYTPAQVSGDFVQKKEIKEVDITLTSRGKFEIDKTQGIKWQTLKPYASTVIISEGKLCMGEDVMDSKNNQVLGHVIKVMQSLLTQDHETLKKYFDYTIKEKDGVYSISLKTTDKTMASVFTKLEAKAQKYVEEVKMYNDKGDITTIIFSNMTEKTGEISCGK